jgi:large subunit ribosomal protein L9
VNKNVKLLLIENVEGQGIVGDVVNVRVGYARNFLLPRGLATEPSEELVAKLASKRAEAQKLLAEQRKQREALTEKLKGVEITLIRSCNDQGILYGAITQQEVASQLSEKGFAVKPRDVRLSQAIKRVDSYDVHIKLDSDLDAQIKLHVQADRKLEKVEEETAAASSEHAKPEGGEGEGRDGERKPRKSKGGESEGRKKSALDLALEAAAADANKKKGGGEAAGDAKKGDKAEKKAKAKA